MCQTHKVLLCLGKVSQYTKSGKHSNKNLNARQAQGFLSFFKTLPKDLRAVRLFNRRDYYTAHGDDATFIAKTYYHTTTALRQLGNGVGALCSVSVSRNMFETIARDILLDRMDRTLELYEGSCSNWRLVKSGTPGNFGSFEDILFANNEMQDSLAIVALVPNFDQNGCTVGLGYVDITRRVLGLADFLDDSHFTNLESALVALGCRECLVPTETGKSSECRPLYDAISRCGVMVTERTKTEFKGRDLVQDLGRLVKGSIEPVRDLVSGFECATGALGCILSYAELLADESNYGNYTVKQYNLNSYMRLDSAAMRALNVMESKSDANKNFSLFGLMNRTCTAGMGKRLLHMWLKQPLLDVDEINCRLDIVQAFVEDAALRQDLRQHLKRTSDIERLTHNLERKRASLLHIVKLYQSAIRIPYIKSVLEHYDGQFATLIRERYIDSLEKWSDDNHLNKFIALVETAVDLDQLENGEYMISSAYDPNLSALKDEQETPEQQIHNLHKQTANDLDLPLDKITKKEEPKIRRQLNSQYIVLETRKDGGDRYQKIIDEYKSCQKELVARVVQTVASFSEDTGDIILEEGCRHPCVEAQDWVNFIPNDCRLVRGESWFQIITGPNLGGKSTYIRQVGVNVLMAQVGSFVPCDNAIVSLRDCIFARVGAGDCQLKGVSTFMQEMLETTSILKGATNRSLVIIDELGRGTSTYDCFDQTVRTDRTGKRAYHELIALGDKNGNNGHKQIVGVANFHFWYSRCELANFPQSDVALAAEKASALEDFSPNAMMANDRKEAYYLGGSMRPFSSTPTLTLDKMDLKQALQQLSKMKTDLEKNAVDSRWLQQFFSSPD
ncbi:unnamed protein product [Withania somnifera]